MSLIETLLAIFLLLVSFLMFATLFQWLLSSSRRADQAAQAARLASDRLAQLRDWAAQPAGSSDNFRAGAWSSLAVPIEMEPGFQVAVHVLASQCHSPSSALEAAFASPRSMNQACKRIRIRVEWKNQTFDLYSQLTAPVVDPMAPLSNNIQVTADFVGALSAGGSGQLTAQARDSQGEGIDDLVYLWTVVPETGTAEILPLDRNHHQVKILNNQPLIQDGDTLKVAITASYRGQVLQGLSSTIVLDGP